MITMKNLPENFKPCNYLKVCSNVILGGAQIFEVGEALPLLVGFDEGPRIWLQGVTAGTHDFVTLVSDSKTAYEGLEIISKGKNVEIKIGNKTIIHAETYRENGVIINHLDLRLIGLKIYGNQKELHIIDKKVNNQKIEGVDIAFGIKIITQ